jgi:hypothetical protein
MMSGDDEHRKDQTDFLPAIQRGRLDCLRIYDVTEHELQLLKEGAPTSTLLNFAIFLLSVASTLAVVLFTTQIPSSVVRIVFTLLAVLFGANGILLLCLWWPKRRSVSELVESIRRRLPAEGIQEVRSTTIAVVREERGVG